MKSRELIKVGFWWSKHEPHLPMPIPRNNAIDPHVGVILTYLTSLQFKGPTYRGSSQCRICSIRNGSSDFSDGVYLWPEGLAHYVRDHHIRLPEHFVQHILEQTL